MEFLMTYGWAILVVLIAIVYLFAELFGKPIDVLFILLIVIGGILFVYVTIMTPDASKSQKGINNEKEEKKDE